MQDSHCVDAMEWQNFLQIHGREAMASTIKTSNTDQTSGGRMGVAFLCPLPS